MAEETLSSEIDVLKVIKEREVITLSTGIKVKLKSVPPKVIQDINKMIPDPPVPTVEVEVGSGEDKKIRIEKNPSDPDYLLKKREALNLRIDKMLEIVAILGVELVEDVPDPKEDPWLDKLKKLEKRGLVDLKGYDLKDEEDLEIVYKSYVAVGITDLNMLTNALGLSEEKVAQAGQSFRGM